MGLKIASYGLSIKGEDHKENEDTILVDDEKGLYAVADGVTVPFGGGLASRLAIDSLGFLFRDDLEQVIRQINKKVLEEKKRDPKIGSTTLTVAHFDSGRIMIAHVGDSSALVIRNGRIVLKTVPQIRQGLLTNAIGEYFDPEMIRLQETGSAEHLVLATDGVTAVLGEDEILRIVLVEKEPKRIVNYCLGEVGERSREYRDDRSLIVVRLEAGR